VDLALKLQARINHNFCRRFEAMQNVHHKRVGVFTSSMIGCGDG